LVKSATLHVCDQVSFAYSLAAFKLRLKILIHSCDTLATNAPW
jgi:hypothetical protein